MLNRIIRWTADRLERREELEGQIQKQDLEIFELKCTIARQHALIKDIQDWIRRHGHPGLSKEYLEEIAERLPPEA